MHGARSRLFSFKLHTYTGAGCPFRKGVSRFLLFKEELQARIEDGYLTISASKGLDKDETQQDGSYIRRERYVGQCSRSFYIGEAVTQDEIKAKFEDGILRLSIPKKDQK